ncbi:hypothetical protein AC482_04655 [miscellaneous Crenarchaeota group-15 archaeon DG-45]|uniref:Uncharacterized protein n=1 Tax=miscellaneous Crenarchaeota group-15 archaeon DG-45 TaxID=1685127 RepID=A0A0M0BP32_9ARCH|nr:MAG: hypothetical protein AC482_04655 [miscellaneous Crenarchaeota group-15 archaeon DG-45]
MSEEAWRRLRLDRKRLEVAARAHELMQRVQGPASFDNILVEVKKAGRISWGHEEVARAPGSHGARFGRDRG